MLPAAAVLLKHSLLHLGWLISLPDSRLMIMWAALPLLLALSSALPFPHQSPQSTEHTMHYDFTMGTLMWPFKSVLNLLIPKTAGLIIAKPQIFTKGCIV